jgi:hypothetical protein
MIEEANARSAHRRMLADVWLRGVKGERFRCRAHPELRWPRITRQALDWRAGKVLPSWELPAAASLRLALRASAPSRHAALPPVYDRFTEGSIRPTSKPQKRFSTLSIVGVLRPARRDLATPINLTPSVPRFPSYTDAKLWRAYCEPHGSRQDY